MHRLDYQKLYARFEIDSCERVLDVGSGGDPFPFATVVFDRFVEPTCHRRAKIVTNGKPLVLGDIHALPFADGAFDYVYCAHVLEHVEDPIRACAEIMRVGKRGFIETPNFAKDMLFAWAKGMHKWHVVSIARNLCFFEMTNRELEGIRSSAWREIIFSGHHHPLQEAFYLNQDVFNVLFPWEHSFGVVEFRLDGGIRTLNVNTERTLHSPTQNPTPRNPECGS